MFHSKYLGFLYNDFNDHKSVPEITNFWIDIFVIYPSSAILHIPHWCFQSILPLSWWRHQMETFSALLALCAGNSPVTGEFSAQKPMTRSFDVFFGLPLNKRLSKQWRGWWFEAPSRSLWRHCNMLPSCQPCYHPRDWEAWIINYIYAKLGDELLIQALPSTRMNLGYGWVITSSWRLRM